MLSGYKPLKAVAKSSRKTLNFVHIAKVHPIIAAVYAVGRRLVGPGAIAATMSQIEVTKIERCPEALNL